MIQPITELGRPNSAFLWHRTCASDLVDCQFQLFSTTQAVQFLGAAPMARSLSLPISFKAGMCHTKDQRLVTFYETSGGKSN
jgi:hypothetical protein